MTASLGAQLRDRVKSGPALVTPGTANALAARIIQDVGYETVYVTGAGIANSFLGVPDIGLVTLTELAAHVQAIRDAVDVPLIVDADTGFGNPVGVTRTVRVLEAAGADAIQIEDQVSPKRCGHFEGKAVVATDDMLAKIGAAMDARRNDTLLIARTDALATQGFEAAVGRARRYAEAGADLTFVEGPGTVEELLALPDAVPVPQVANLVEGGETPLLPVAELQRFGVVLLANIALQGAIRGMQRVLRHVLDTGSVAAAGDLIADWSERQRLVGKPHYDALGERYRC